MRRRQFAFWFGFGLFSLGEKLRVGGLDKLAAATMRFAEPAVATAPTAPPEHWAAAENKTWRWYERENLVDGRWKLTGITTPIHKQTGERYTGKTGYLDDHLVPVDLQFGDHSASAEEDVDESIELAPHLPNAARKARHGRPPSKWLRSLHADEIRVWLKTIEVPEADVSGMTFWEHLTRDHSFDPDKIAGLTEGEQAKLHAAAHYGY
jgi:hypothetical protein